MYSPVQSLRERPSAVPVIGHRRPSTVLILLSRKAAGSVVDIAAQETSRHVDSHGPTAGGIKELVRDQVAQRIAGSSLPAKSVEGRACSVAPGVDDCQPLPDRIIHLARGKSVGVNGGQSPSIGVVHACRNIAQGIRDRYASARRVVRKAGAIAERIHDSH